MEMHYKFRIKLSLILILISYSNCKPLDYETSGYVVGGVNTTSSDLQDMKKLFKQILSDYDTRLRPRLNQSHSVIVNSEFIPNAIVNFDTTGQKIDILGFFRVSWMDDITTWNASEFGGTNVIMVPLADVWYPKLIIDKSYAGNGVIGDRYTDIVQITDEGRVRWVPNGIYGCLCNADATFYPNDVQICDLQFYVTDQIVLNVELHTSPEVALTDFTENSEWRLLKVSSYVNLKYGTNIVSVRFEIERRASFTIYTIVIPLFTLSVLSIVTFIVPIESGEKGSLSITIFLAYGFFIAITRDSLPHNSVDIPYFVIYTCALLILSLFTVLYVMVESKIYYTIGTKTLNHRYFRLSQWLPKSIKVTQGNQSFDQNKFSKSAKSKKQTRNTRLINVSKIRAEDSSVHISNSQQSIENGDNYTWTDFLRLVNLILFCVSFLFLFIFSIVLWTKVAKRQA